MAETQFETDEFLKLLSEALRAGPGSPAWREAITCLTAERLTEADEYRLLMTVREDLESGRGYRAIRAGPGFTRKVMQRVEEEAQERSRGIPTPTLIAILAGAVIVATIAILAVVLYRSHPSGGTLADLSATYFSKPLLASDFSQSIPPEWKKFGQEPVISVREKGLRAGPARGDKDYKTGGISFASPIPAGRSFAIEATIRMARPTSQVYVQVFVSEDPLSGSAREFVVNLKDGSLGSYGAGDQEAGPPVSVQPGSLSLTIKMNQQFVIVQRGADNREEQLYEGPHGLSGQAARYVGVRFGAQGGKEAGLEDVVVQSIRILEP